MNQDWILSMTAWANTYKVSLIWSVAVVISYLLLTKLAMPLIESKVDHSKLKGEAAQKAYHALRLLAGVFTIAVLLLVWGIDFSGLLVLSTSLITLTGVALFASWSLLSNVTAYFVLLFHNSFRRGNFIRIIDVDNYIEGYVAEVNLFNTKLITEDREVIVYPNNLILNRPTLVNPRQKLNAIGKVTEQKPLVESLEDKNPESATKNSH